MKMEREREVNSAVILWVWGEHARERKKERELERRNVYKKKKLERKNSKVFFLSLGSE